MKKICTVIILSAVLFSAHTAFGNSVASSEHVQVELFSEVESVKPSEPFWVGVRMTMRPEWHTYWQNPGDAGLGTQIEWKLPEGFSAGSLQWPFPTRIEILPLVDFGYEGEIILLSEITPPSVVPSPNGIYMNTVSIGAKIDWLECKDICIPGGAEVDLTLPVTNETPVQNASRVQDFERARTQIPKKIDSANEDWNFRAARIGEKISIFFKVPGNSAIGDVTFFPSQGNIINYAEKQELRQKPEGYELELTLSKLLEGEIVKINGVLVSSSGWSGPGTEKAIEIEAPVESLGRQQKPLSVGAALVAAQDGQVRLPDFGGQAQGLPLQPSARNDVSLRFALAFAFVGGLLLNLMPCVLPVLSIKILGFIKQAGENPKAAKIHGLLFGFGVLVSFWLLAFAIIALRAGGKQLGWGFQLQSSAFVASLASLFFLLALNLFGMFEWGNFFTRAGEATSQIKGYLNSFLSGFLATIIATPCTAPFMGAALGFGLTQPPWASFLIFTSLALGMALPYLLLSLNPALLRFVPKPGGWMITLKKIMALPLLATTVWLVWVLHVQIGNYVFLVMPASLLFLTMGGWNLNSSSFPRKRESKDVDPRFRGGDISVLIAFALIALGFVWATVGAAWSEAMLTETGASLESKPAISDGMGWESFSGERLAELRAEGKPVFIDFTAAWCLTCQVNEKLALHSKSVRDKFRELGVVMLKADWTRRDENITRAIQGYGRSGVPLYVLYHSKDENPVILPEVVTSKIVLDALEKIDSARTNVTIR